MSAPWIRDFVDEVLSFPVGRHDDQTDCLSYAVEVLNNGGYWGRSLINVPDTEDDWDTSDGMFGLPKGKLARQAQWRQLMRHMHVGGPRFPR